MTKLRLVPSLLMFAVYLAACAPAESTVNVPQTAVVELGVTSPTPVPTVNTTLQATAGSTESLPPAPPPVATSRGPNLEATDPTTVNLASGGVQLVEFFRFT